MIICHFLFLNSFFLSMSVTKSNPSCITAHGFASGDKLITQTFRESVVVHLIRAASRRPLSSTYHLILLQKSMTKPEVCLAK